MTSATALGQAHVRREYQAPQITLARPPVIGGLRNFHCAFAVLAFSICTMAACTPMAAHAEFIRLAPTYTYSPSSPFVDGSYPEFPYGLEAIAAIQADYQSKLDALYRVDWGSVVTSPGPGCAWSPAIVNQMPEALCVPMTLYRKNTPDGPWEFQVSATFSATLRFHCPSGFSGGGRALTSDPSGYPIVAEQWCEGFASLAPYVRPELPLDEGPSCRAGDADMDGKATPHPIVPATGDKIRSETDHAEHSPHGLSFVRTYASGRAKADSAVPLGKGWRHNHSASVLFTPMTTNEPELATVTLGNGNTRRFRKDDSYTHWAPLSGKDQLLVDADGTSTYVDADTDARYVFAPTGLLSSLGCSRPVDLPDAQRRHRRPANHFISLRPQRHPRRDDLASRPRHQLPP